MENLQNNIWDVLRISLRLATSLHRVYRDAKLLIAILTPNAVETDTVEHEL